MPYEQLAALLNPNEDDKRQAMNMGLLNFGAGLLANNTGHYGQLGPALGAGMSQGLQGYQQTMQANKSNRVQDMLMKMKLEEMNKPKDIDYNQPMLPNGQPNVPYQDYQQSLRTPTKPEPAVNWTVQATDKGLIQINPQTGETRPLGYGAPKKEINPLVEAKIEQARIDKEKTLDQQSLSAQQVLDQAGILFAHPGKQMATGASSFMSNIPGTNAKGFQANLDTFKAQTFVPMVSALKGMGALSDAEGKKLSESVGALDPSMPESEFNDSMRTVTKYLYDKAKAAGLKVSLPSFAMPEQKQQAPVKIKGDNDYNALPSGAEFIAPDGVLRRKP